MSRTHKLLFKYELWQFMGHAAIVRTEFTIDNILIHIHTHVPTWGGGGTILWDASRAGHYMQFLCIHKVPLYIYLMAFEYGSSDREGGAL